MIYVTFLFNLFLTILVEGVVTALLFRRLEFVYYSLLCNILTNPALNLVLLFVTHFMGAAYYGAALLILELTAVFIEAHVLKLLCGFPFTKAVAVSGLMNVLSCMAGLLIY